MQSGLYLCCSHMHKGRLAHNVQSRLYEPRREKTGFLCCDYIKKYSRPIEFLYFYRPINIILSAAWSDYIKYITRRLPKSVPKSTIDSFKYDIGRLIGRSSPDRRPTIGRSSNDCQNTKTVGRCKKIITR